MAKGLIGQTLDRWDREQLTLRVIAQRVNDTCDHGPWAQKPWVEYTDEERESLTSQVKAILDAQAWIADPPPIAAAAALSSICHATTHALNDGASEDDLYETLITAIQSWREAHE